jgi:hypothetical protein
MPYKEMVSKVFRLLCTSMLVLLGIICLISARFGFDPHHEYFSILPNVRLPEGVDLYKDLKFQYGPFYVLVAKSIYILHLGDLVKLRLLGYAFSLAGSVAVMFLLYRCCQNLKVSITACISFLYLDYSIHEVAAASDFLDTRVTQKLLWADDIGIIFFALLVGAIMQLAKKYYRPNRRISDLLYGIAIPVALFILFLLKLSFFIAGFVTFTFITLLLLKNSSSDSRGAIFSFILVTCMSSFVLVSCIYISHETRHMIGLYFHSTLDNISSHAEYLSGKDTNPLVSKLKKIGLILFSVNKRWLFCYFTYVLLLAQESRVTNTRNIYFRLFESKVFVIRAKSINLIYSFSVLLLSAYLVIYPFILISGTSPRYSDLLSLMMWFGLVSLFSTTYMKFSFFSKSHSHWSEVSLISGGLFWLLPNTVYSDSRHIIWGIFFLAPFYISFVLSVAINSTTSIGLTCSRYSDFLRYEGYNYRLNLFLRPRSFKDSGKADNKMAAPLLIIFIVYLIMFYSLDSRNFILQRYHNWKLVNLPAFAESEQGRDKEHTFSLKVPRDSLLMSTLDEVSKINDLRIYPTDWRLSLLSMYGDGFSTQMCLVSSNASYGPNSNLRYNLSDCVLNAIPKQERTRLNFHHVDRAVFQSHLSYYFSGNNSVHEKL